MAAPPDADLPPRSSYAAGEEALESFLREPPSGARPVPEALLHDLWREQRFRRHNLTTIDDQSLTVLDPGHLNTDSGPDFREAHLRLDGIDWHGDVEIHRTSRGWTNHGHDEDPHYNSTVLHVVLRPDEKTGHLQRADGSPLPELVLLPYLRAPLHQLLHRFHTREESELPCADRWPHVPDDVRKPWIRELALERLRGKRQRLAERFLVLPSLEALLHERLFAGLGYAKNAEPMADLARRLPLRLVRAVEDPADLEALHLGTAGLLPDPNDLLDADRTTADYALELRHRFEHLRERHSLSPMEKTRWQFFRLRPANFPPLRISQAVALLQPGQLLHRDPIGTLLHALQSERPVKALRNALEARPSPFWETHFRLEKATKPRDPSIGKRRIDTLLINAVLPTLLLHAEQESIPALHRRITEAFEQFPAASDRVTRRFKALGTRPKSALEAQGLHQLYRTRCTEARCLTCAIGRFLLE